MIRRNRFCLDVVASGSSKRSKDLPGKTEYVHRVPAKCLLNLKSHEVLRLYLTQKIDFRMMLYEPAEKTAQGIEYTFNRYLRVAKFGELRLHKIEQKFPSRHRPSKWLAIQEDAIGFLEG